MCRYLDLDYLGKDKHLSGVAGGIDGKYDPSSKALARILESVPDILAGNLSNI